MNTEKNDNQSKVKKIIKRMTGAEAKVVAVPYELFTFAGNTQKAVFLAQLIYWSDRASRSDKFVYKTYEQWKEETGLSASQIKSYSEEFAERGFLETKLKKANGNPTLHYKLDFAVFLYSFAKFIDDRKPKNLEVESQESEESLTENTPEITPVYYSQDSDESRRWSYRQGKEVTKTEENVNGDVSKLYFHNGNQKLSAGNSEEPILIPDDFSATWENKYQAAMKFPDKSPAHLTLKFYSYYKGKDVRMTLSEWQNKWWEWIEREKPTDEHNEEDLKAEHYKIKHRVWNLVFGVTYKIDKKIIHLEEFYSLSKKHYSQETIAHCLNILVINKHLACIGGYYFNLKEYLKSPEWKIEVETDARKLGIDLSNI